MENSPSVKSIAYTYGVLMAAYSILVLVLVYVFNFDQQSWVVGGINALVSIVLFTLAIKSYKTKNSNYLSIKEALKVGLATALIAGLISAIYVYVHYNFVYPEFLDLMREKAYSDMLDSGMEEKQITQAMEMSSFTTTPWFFATMTIVSSLFFGFLISLIVGLILKKENPAHQ
ncbi:DUF4199 domain-containing protein [Christiangramia salexigens]|uniref:DUF4199 domain-containing protein n=1 Tax=Christiangramia salexigens TaxID=1913577 RepID=A0A1L3J3M5_9FLAO|nr:DUF4199 domain-containing protein [Christiangramia salexigens]APG59731.1 hypothetical protein LPB144_04570 [Christiangramia salexigens]